MPENDVLRFVIVLIVLMFLMALAVKTLEFLAERSKQKGRIAEIKLEIDLAEKEGRFADYPKKEDTDDVEDGSSGN
jgi:hypothetical protein